MFRGFYTAASGMIAQQRQTELLSNNVANANTPGYKADQSTIRSFPEMLLSSVEKQGSASLQNGFNPSATKTVGSISTGVYMQETLPDYSQGSITSTDLSTDIALIDGNLPMNEETGKAGAVFYHVQSADGGDAYTRNGSFTVDGQGYLTNATGNYVLSSNNERIQVQSEDFIVNEQGEVLENDQVVARIGVSYSAEPDTLKKADNGLFFTYNGEALPSAEEAEDVSYSFKQGYIEQSNVDAASTMTNMTTAYRAFEANQKILTAYDKNMEKTVELGRV